MNIQWGNGETTLFLEMQQNNDSVRVLDYEYDHEEIHRRCGGSLSYVSNSELSGRGRIIGYGDLIRVGYYRVDTRFFWYTYPEEVGVITADCLCDYRKVRVMLPYEAHTEDKKHVLEAHPTVIMVDNSTVVYCKFDNLLKTLKNVFEQKIEYAVLERRFVSLPCMAEVEVQLKYKNFFGKGPYPWVFAKKILENSEVHRQNEEEEECLDTDFSMYRRDWYGWKYVRTERIDGIEYAVELLLTGGHDPLDFTSRYFNPEVSIFTKGQWKKVCHDDNIVIMANSQTNVVRLIGWTKTAIAYPKRVERASRLVQGGDWLKNWCNDMCQESTYVKVELKVPKVLWVQNKKQYISQVRAGVARKVAYDVCQAIRWRSDVGGDFAKKGLVDP